MASKLAITEDGSSRIKKNLYDWKYPKIPTDQVYKKKVLTISPSYALIDFEDTISVNGNDKSVSGSLLSSSVLDGLIKKHHSFLHLGLVQVAVKPLMRDGLGAAIVVCLRDTRQPDFQNSLLALVKANLCQGPFYFNCFPNFSVSLDDTSLFEVLTLDVETSGIPLALTYRVVCKAMVDLSPESLKELVLGVTTYFQPAIGTSGVTRWTELELQVHESSTSKQESETYEGDLHQTLPDAQVHKKGKSVSTMFGKEKEGRSDTRTKHDDWEYPKIAVNQVYNDDTRRNEATIWEDLWRPPPSLWSKAKKLLNVFPSNTIKDFEKTITLRANNPVNVSIKVLEEFIKKKKGYVHLGLFQIAIKPLMNDDLGAPILVCLRDTRAIGFKNSLLALVEANPSEGPFSFICSPGHSVALEDRKLFTLNVKSGVPLLLKYRVVCNVTTKITMDPWKSINRGETTFYHHITWTETTSKWDEVQVPKSWTSS